MTGMRMPTKVCAACGTAKLVDCFNRDKSQPDGFQRRCRACWQQTYVKQGKKKNKAEAIRD